jgi:50S ribosomal subunit-associated GTPase HflX
MYNLMNQLDNFAEEDERRRTDVQHRMRESAAIARYAHAGSSKLLRRLRRAADAVDPTGRLRPASS